MESVKSAGHSVQTIKEEYVGREGGPHCCTYSSAEGEGYDATRQWKGICIDMYFTFTGNSKVLKKIEWYSLQMDNFHTKHTLRHFNIHGLYDSRTPSNEDTTMRPPFTVPITIFYPGNEESVSLLIRTPYLAPRYAKISVS